MIKALNPILFLSIIGMGAYLIVALGGDSVALSEVSPVFIAIIVVALLLGILLVMPIGGADMPVVIALLNSYSGLAAAAAGFVLDNMILIVSGSLVGSVGTHPDYDNVPGDEPLHLERHLRSVRG